MQKHWKFDPVHIVVKECASKTVHSCMTFNSMIEGRMSLYICYILYIYID